MQPGAVQSEWVLEALNTAAFDALDMRKPARDALASIPHNTGDNRYPDILPAIPTLVRLPAVGNDPKTQYINANFIRGPEGQKNRYIACQG
jgi:protein tyrosine phosphatase